MKKIFISILLSFFGLSTMIMPLQAEQYSLLSPGGNISVEINTHGQISYAVYFNGTQVIAPSPISLHTEKHGAFGIDPKVRSSEQHSIDRVLTPVVKQKSSEIEEAYNELRINFKGNYSLCFRAFDEGVAYRWESAIKEELVIVSEEANFIFTGNHMAWFPEEESMFSHQEREYLYLPLEEITPDRFSSAPMLVDVAGGPKIAITESDLRDYPGFYVQGGGANYSLKAKFPNVVIKEEMKRDRDLVPVQRADYIAVVDGMRTFPWRIIGIAAEDKDLITNQMVFLLAEECRIEDPSWIKPGKVAWDWWNYNNIYKVDFVAGVNTETYKYYIDFAAAKGIEYIILDEGWYELGDLTRINPDIDMPELLAYGREKNVGIILWVVWKTLDDQLQEVMPLFEEWGIAGLKVDFMQRDDQWMVNYYWRIAEEAASRKFLVDFHGSYKPAGLHRTY
ncbi:MAG TPA: glycoside hydrolase family 97 catalytic domain-containing protein, partial [Bacteroidales bacterium]|nr:glycoside hydrolase family 97 catalytic domain-containing protein [Bacteroidales bacterium]